MFELLRSGASLRSGAWLTHQRLRVYPAMLLAIFVIAGLGLIATARHGKDFYGHPLGADFVGVWTAGHEVVAGDPVRPYDVAAYKADQDRLFGSSDGFYIWPYPPFFLAVAAFLALCPYGIAFLLWESATLALYLASIFAALRPARFPAGQVFVAALAFPAVFINLTHGQNGFLTAGLLGFALVLLPRRPLAAGLCFALLTYKPHLGLLIVPALVAGGEWRALASGAAGLAAMVLASLAGFGMGPWHGFFDHLGFARAMLEVGATGFGKFVSPFAAIRLLGGSVPLAYATQALVTAALLIATVLIWRSKTDVRLKAAVLIAANLIATPYAFDYDLVALGPALAFALSYGLNKGFRPYEKSGLALVFIAPLLARPAASVLFFPIGPLAVLLFVVGALLRIRAEAKAS